MCIVVSVHKFDSPYKLHFILFNLRLKVYKHKSRLRILGCGVVDCSYFCIYKHQLSGYVSSSVC